jgi:hypothetical protein
MASGGVKYISRIDSYEGDSTSRKQENWAVRNRGASDFEINDVVALWAVICILNGKAEIVDDGYRSYEEAKAAWGDAA